MVFIGNTKAVNLLNKAIGNGKISQAYLFPGPESVGKLTLAKIFADSIISERNIFKNDLLAVAIKEKDELDLTVIEPEIEEKKGIKKTKDIKIEKIREMQRELALYPYDGKKKVLIVNDAHRMTVSAQNALLKSLEEPNKTSVIILITHDEAAIISTIKSRCQKINFFLAEEEEMKKLFKDDKNKELIEFSMGRPGLATRMKENQEEFDAKEKDYKELESFSSWGINERLGLAEKMAVNLAETIKKLEFWMWIIRLKSLSENSKQEFFSFKTIEKISKVLETIKTTNANARLAIENLFLEI
jgi:DNA polymerase-3 subunit delta'